MTDGLNKDGSEFVWRPSEERISRANVKRLMDKLNSKTFEELRERSIEDLSGFWSEVEQDLNISWFKRYSRILDDSKGIEWTKWFVGGRINLAYNCLDKHLKESSSADRLALISENEEPGNSKRMSYGQLDALTNRLANALTKTLGIRKGDKVGVYMPMIPEAVAAFLGIVKAGAVVIPIFSGYGSEAIASRLTDCEAVALITAASFRRRDKLIQMEEIALEACKGIPIIKSILVFNRTGVDKQPTRRVSRSSTIADLRIFGWDVVNSQSNDFACEQMDSEDPFMIIYTSGTTGKPKGAVHVHGGFLVKIVEEVAYQGDVKPDDVLFWFTDMGWIMAPWELVGGLSLGCTVLLYDGAPDYPTHDRLWQVVEDNRVTFLGVSPTLIRGLMRYGADPAKKHDLSSLRSFGSTGEPWNPESYNWLFQNIGRGRVPIINLSGGTEVGACFLSVHPVVPAKMCSLGGPCLGIDADVFDENGNPVRNRTGELVVKKAWPSMTSGLWKNSERYLEAYWSRFPGVWVHGDWASIDQDGYWFLHGRSDDTLKIAGKRVGPTEIESVLASHPSVLESVAIGVPDEVKGESAVCFVVLRPGAKPSQALGSELQDHVGKMLGQSLKPSSVKFVQSIPKTRNAKLVRRLVRAKFLNLPLGDMSNLENPEALDGISKAQ